MLKKINDSTKNKILLIITALLAVLYILSFTQVFSSKDRREKLKTSLVNPKYKETISSFELSDAAGTLEIVKKGSFWTADSIPLSNERMEKLIFDLTTIRNLYKISDKITKNSTFGLTNGTEFHLRYFTDTGFHELVFGNQDFSLSSRYMMTEKSTQVYEIDDSFDKYLTTSIQSWCEPYIISREVLGHINQKDIQTINITESENGRVIKYSKLSDSEKIKNLLELRHGGSAGRKAENLLLGDNTLTLNIELGNKKSINLEIYDENSPNETSYIVKSEYKNEAGKTEYTALCKISGWTYNRIKEITL